MKICETCQTEHDSTYGSGRFCSVKCARGFSTKNKRIEINEKVSNTLKGRLINRLPTGCFKKTRKLRSQVCKHCQKEFDTLSPTQRYCSKSCSAKSRKWNETQRAVDWSSIHKKAYSEGRNFIAGGTTKWFDYNGIKVQGSYELRTCQILDIWKKYNIIKDWEYTKDTIQYVGEDGKSHTYLLDFKVYTNENFFYYIEVKGYETSNDLLKWKAVKESGNILEVWFEKDIIRIEKETGLLV